MKTPAALLIATLVPLAAQARIGETFDEIAKRFAGAQLIEHKDGEALWLLADEMGYMVYFDEKGVSMMETIMTKDALTKLTEAQVRKFLHPQLPEGAKWVGQTLDPQSPIIRVGKAAVKVNFISSECYLSSDGTLYAELDKLRLRTVSVANETGLLSLQAKKQKREEEQATGF